MSKSFKNSYFANRNSIRNTIRTDTDIGYLGRPVYCIPPNCRGIYGGLIVNYMLVLSVFFCYNVSKD